VGSRPSLRTLDKPFLDSMAEDVSCGTELDIVQEGLPEAIPTEMCYLGWQESLAQLAKLVEPEIPD